LPVATLFQRPTIAHLADGIAGHEAPTHSPLLVPILPGGSRPPLFCIHGIGGEALFLAPLARHLAPSQALYGLRARGLDADDEPDTDVRAMAARYIEAIRTIVADGPYFLAGFSAGGIVAFEMAQQLSAQGHQVALLAIVDQSPPNPVLSQWLWSPEELARFLQNLPLWIRDDMLRSRPDQLFRRTRGKLRILWHRLLARIRPAYRRPAIDIEAMFGVSQLPARFLKLLEANSRALAEYEPQRYPGRIDLFRARTDRLGRPRPTDLGWGAFAAGGVKIHPLPGTHASIVEEPNVRVLAERLTACLAELPPTAAS
jgi:thioesterase domain-containing protein